MAKNIRSEYIKNLLEDKEALQAKMDGITESTIKSLLEDKVKDNLRQIISEDANAFDEEEVKDEPVTTDDDQDNNSSEDDNDDINDDDVNIDSDIDDDLGTGNSSENSDDDTDVWKDLENYKGEDGEYDLTGMDAENVIKVLKVMKPEDGVRVVKSDDGKQIELTDDETNKEYIIQIDLDDDIDDSIDDDNDDDREYEIELDGLGEAENHGNVGYTSNYQRNTAMTTPSNHEPANPRNTYSMDKGVPTGTGKPFPGKGNKSPYDNEVNEGEGCNHPMDEAMTTQEHGAYNRGTGMVHTNTNSKAAKGRNSHAGGRQIHGTADNSYSEATLENIKRKANSIFLENKQLKNLLPKFKEQLQEALVINQSLGNIVNILKENATTADEKVDIVKRFNDVKTCNESNELYKTITEELHRTHHTQNVEDVFNSQLSESSKQPVDTPLYQSDDLSRSLDLMKRLNNL